MRPAAIVLTALLPAACSAGPVENPASGGYRGIEELRVLAKGME
jgi:hypothetical protein